MQKRKTSNCKYFLYREPSGGEKMVKKFTVKLTSLFKGEIYKIVPFDA